MWLCSVGATSLPKVKYISLLRYRRNPVKSAAADKVHKHVFYTWIVVTGRRLLPDYPTCEALLRSLISTRSITSPRATRFTTSIPATT